MDKFGGLIPRTFVTLFSAEGLAETHTDDAGEFRFEHLAPGTYGVEAKYPGFVPTTFEVRIEGENHEVTITLSAAIQGYCEPGKTRVSLVYEQRANRTDLLGIVTHLFSKRPVAGAKVQLFNAKQVWDTTTSSTGEFQFGGIEPGKYTLRASHPDYEDLTVIDDIWIMRRNVVSIPYGIAMKKKGEIFFCM